MNRNPKDTLVSMYYFFKMSEPCGNFTGSWDEFFELFKDRHLLFGDYFDWYTEWVPYIENSSPNVKVVRYEDMQMNLERVILDVASYLDKSLSNDKVSRMVEYLSFSQMKENKMCNYTDSVFLRGDISPFMRKGIVGDWKTFFRYIINSLIRLIRH